MQLMETAKYIISTCPTLTGKEERSSFHVFVGAYSSSTKLASISSPAYSINGMADDISTFYF